MAEANDFARATAAAKATDSATAGTTVGVAELILLVSSIKQTLWCEKVRERDSLRIETKRFSALETNQDNLTATRWNQKGRAATA
jgi:hypothetical protein